MMKKPVMVMTLRCVLLVAVSCVSIAWSSAASEAAVHTPDSEFRGVDPPKWVLDGAVKMFLPLDDLRTIDEAAAAGVTVVHGAGPAPYWPLRRDDPSSGVAAAERERLGVGIARAKQHGMRVVLGISPYAPVEMVRKHPEWMRHEVDDPSILEQAQLDLTAPEHIARRSLPLHTPYGDYAIECLAEIMQDLEVDGFSFDGCYHHPIDFSPHEKEIYRRETGREVPPRIDLQSEDYRLYLLWADEKLEGWYRRLGRRLRSVNPEAAIYTWTTNAGRYGHFLTSPRVMSARMNRLIDCPVQEWWLDEVNHGATVIPNFGAAYVRAVAGGRVGASEPYLMSRGNPYSTDSFPRHELTVRCLGAMTNGSFTPLATMAGREATFATLREIARRKEWFVHLTQEPWAAMLVSELSRQFYAHGHIMDRWLAHSLGIFRMAMEEHLPLTIITEQDLAPEILQRHRVLILPNVACLSDAQASTIRRFVQQGGGLVATCETSLCDELGRPRDDFALNDVFGASYGGRVHSLAPSRELDANFAIAINDAYWMQRANAGAFRFGDFPDSIFASDARLRQLVPNGQASFKGPMVRMRDPRTPMAPAILHFPEGSRDPFPCALTGSFGSGRVVYLAGGVDAAYFSYGFPYQRVMLSQSVRWAAGDPYPVRVEAPMCVQSTFWRQSGPDGPRLIIHLWNGLNTTSDHGLQEAEVPLREEAVPIHGIKIHFASPPAGPILLQPDNLPCDIMTENGRPVVLVPPVAIHGAVVIPWRDP